eukprot:scpid50958/ scgid18963/ 
MFFGSVRRRMADHIDFLSNRVRGTGAGSPLVEDFLIPELAAAGGDGRLCSGLVGLSALGLLVVAVVDDGNEYWVCSVVPPEKEPLLDCLAIFGLIGGVKVFISRACAISVTRFALPRLLSGRVSTQGKATLP